MRDGYAHPARPGAKVSRRDLLRLGRGPLFREDVDYEAAASRVRDEWAGADRTAWLRAIEPVASVLVEVAGVHPGWRVLDAATGDGNVALAAAAAGADVDACDFTPAMVARARERARSGAGGAAAAGGADEAGGAAELAPAARVSLADVQALTYPDGTFDAVLSAFGFALAPRALRTARELVRVCKPGGVVALAAWVPRGLPGGLFEHLPRPAGVPSPGLWGHEPRVRERLEPLLDALEVRTRSVTLAFESPDALCAQLTAEARPAFDALLAAGNHRPPAAVVGARYLIIRGVRRPTHPAPTTT